MLAAIVSQVRHNRQAN